MAYNAVISNWMHTFIDKINVSPYSFVISV